MSSTRALAAILVTSCAAESEPPPPKAPQVLVDYATAPTTVASHTPPPDACASTYPSNRADYPVPGYTETAGTPEDGWFFDGKSWHALGAACDLPDRVVMLDDAFKSMLIWTRKTGATRTFPVDETQGHTGHSTSIVKRAPADDQVFDVMRDNSMFHGSVGPTYGEMSAGRGGEQPTTGSVDHLVACSTLTRFAEIDARDPGACTTYPDGVGWPLSITVSDANDARTTTTGSLATISADRKTWTYRFGDIELELRVGDKHGGELRVGGKTEPCVMMFADHRRTDHP